MNFAKKWLDSTRYTDVFLCKASGIPREYFRAVRKGEPPPTRNSGGKRAFADNDPRWQKVAAIAFPTSDTDQQRFVEAITELQTGKASELLPEHQTAPEPHALAQQNNDTATITLHPDFQGTLDFSWNGRTYRLTRTS